jgi:membrane protease YdiL (CAAX protease family)
MNQNEPVLLAYGAIYLAALVLAVWQRKTFPLGSVLPVVLILGVGFTGLIYWVVPQAPILSTPSGTKPAELIFVLAYLGFISYLLVRRKRLSADNVGFIHKKIHDIRFKILFFVLIPVLALRVFWGASWAELGFTQGNLPSQLLTAAVLIFLLGGFNLVAGGAAAPIRARLFNARQLVLGFGLAFAWESLEAGLVEEFFFRGFLQARLVNYMDSPVGGICAASLLFGLAHAPGIYLRGGDKFGPLGERPTLLNSILYAILALSPTGWFTGLLFWRTQSLIAPILVHGGIDAVAATAEFIQGLGFLKQMGKADGDVPRSDS